MTGKIKENINNPEELERLYREDKKSFELEFEKIYHEIETTEMAKFWKSRLDFGKTPGKTTIGFGMDVLIMITICIVAGFLIKIPDLFNINVTTFHFYEKETGIIFFMGLSFYTIALNKRFSKRHVLITIAAFLISAIYINLLPDISTSASIKLVYIHMPLLMWCLYGMVYIDYDLRNLTRRVDYIKHNGELAIMGALIVISGGMLMAISIGLFQAIGIHVEKFYQNYIMIIGFVAAPVLTAFILKNYATFTNKIAPVIANIFSPLVLITLIIYLIEIPLSGKDPYNDRDFLLIFNVMLICVMAIVVFSVSETTMMRKQKFSEIVLFLLSVVTLIINLIALSAIFYRLGHFGLTPNRLAILGSNILFFINLILISIELFKISFRDSDTVKVNNTISKYLPVYLAWVLIVVFLFPVIFGMN